MWARATCRPPPFPVPYGWWGRVRLGVPLSMGWCQGAVFKVAGGSGRVTSRATIGCGCWGYIPAWGTLVALSLHPAQLGDGTWGPLVTLSQYCTALGCLLPVPANPLQNPSARLGPSSPQPAACPCPSPWVPQHGVGGWGGGHISALSPLGEGRRVCPAVAAKMAPRGARGRKEGPPLHSPSTAHSPH